MASYCSQHDFVPLAARIRLEPIWGLSSTALHLSLGRPRLLMGAKLFLVAPLCRGGQQNGVLRCEQDSNLRGNIPLDFESNALTTRPSQLHKGKFQANFRWYFLQLSIKAGNLMPGCGAILAEAARC